METPPLIPSVLSVLAALAIAIQLLGLGALWRLLRRHTAALAELRDQTRLYDLLLRSQSGPLRAKSIQIRHERGTPTPIYDNRWCDVILRGEGGLALFYRVRAEDISDIVARLRCKPE